MKNPFKSLGESKQPEVEYEIYTGCFDCQECFESVFEAKYIESINVLTWICSQGHVSTIKDFE